MPVCNRLNNSCDLMLLPKLRNLTEYHQIYIQDIRKEAVRRVRSTRSLDGSHTHITLTHAHVPHIRETHITVEVAVAVKSGGIEEMAPRLLDLAPPRLRLSLASVCVALASAPRGLVLARLGATSALPRLGNVSASPRIGSTSAACLDAALPPRLTLAAAAVAESCGGGKNNWRRRRGWRQRKARRRRARPATRSGGRAAPQGGCGRRAAASSLKEDLKRTGALGLGGGGTGSSFSGASRLLQSY